MLQMEVVFVLKYAEMDLIMDRFNVTMATWKMEMVALLSALLKVDLTALLDLSLLQVFVWITRIQFLL